MPLPWGSAFHQCQSALRQSFLVFFGKGDNHTDIGTRSVIERKAEF
jgi:hypothetical protein